VITCRDVRAPRCHAGRPRPLHPEFRRRLRAGRIEALARWTGLPAEVLRRLAAGEEVRPSGRVWLSLVCLAWNLGYGGELLACPVPGCECAGREDEEAG
jgi:hypothetical protein